MKFPRPSEGAIARLKAALPAEGVTLKPMFGQVGMFVNGNMAGGTWGETVTLRLSPEDRLDLEDLGGTVFDPMGGRPMREFRLLPVELVEDAETLQTWVRRAIRATAALPPAEPKKEKKKTDKKKAGS